MGISYNKTFLIGRLTRDPEMNYTKGGTAVATFSIAVDRTYFKEGQQDVDFFNITAFGKTAEFVEKYFAKGKLILVEGKVQIDRYEKDGQTKYFTKIIVDRTQFMETKKQAEQNKTPEERHISDLAGEAQSYKTKDDDDDVLPF